MEAYLAQLRKCLENSYSNGDVHVHVIVGNESCDLDSAVSALVFAYFMQWKELQEARSQIAFIPLLNIPRSEYRLRTEVRYVLSEIFGGRVEDWLIFIDEVRLDILSAANRLSLTLVDHHKLSTPALNRYGPIVRRVIDHHVDKEPAHLSYRGQCQGQEDGFSRYVTDAVGSCSTLVAERIISYCSGRSTGSALDENVAKLLLSAILIDTNDLKDSVKTTSRDIAVVEKLEAVLVASRTYNRKRLYDAVKQAKIDVSAMTVLEILAKDYKAIRRAPDAAGSTRTASIGMSTVPLSFEALASHRPNGQGPSTSLELQFETFRQQRQVDALVLSCVSKQPNVPKDRTKQVVIYGGDDADKDRIYNALSTINGLNLSPALLGTDNGINVPIRVYWQGNPGLSRKQLLPALEDMLNGKLERSESVSPLTSPSKSGHSPPSSPSNAAGGSGGAGHPSPTVESSPSSGHSAQSPAGNPASSGHQQGSSTGNRAKRFLDSTDLARSFSVTYDDDEEDYYSGAGPSHQDDQWQNDPRAVGQLGRIDENQPPSALSGDYEFEHADRPSDELSSYSASTTEGETRHYPTVSSPYATSSYEGGGGGGVANGSGNTQEESAATLSGVPDLLDSRENLADVIAGAVEDTPDLLADYHSPSSVTDAPFPPSSKRTFDDYGDVDLLQGTDPSRVGHEFGRLENAVSTDSHSLDDYIPEVNVEPSFSSYPSDIAATYDQEKDVNSPTTFRQGEHLKRELSEPRQFDFSSDPSPADGRSRADTPPSSISRYEDDEDDSRSHGRRFIVGLDDVEDEGLKPPGVRTPPNTYVDHYLEEVAVTNEAVGARRASQQSELEPELLYLKLKGTQFLVKEALTVASPSFLQEGSVPDTPPNSFIGTPVASMMEMAATGETTRFPYDGGRRGSQLEPENLRQRVTELKKNLPPDDVDYQESHGAFRGRAIMDKESPIDSASDIAAGTRDRGDEYYQDQPSDLSSMIIGQFAEQLADSLLTKALAEVFYPEVADDDQGFVNPAFGAGSTATASPLTPVDNASSQHEAVFPDLNAAERSLPDVLSENFPSPDTSAPTKQVIKTPLSTKSSSDLLDAYNPRGLPFDLVSCASAASFGRESTVAHADSTEFNIAGKRADGSKGPDTRDPRVQTDFNDGEDDRGSDFLDEDTANAENVGDENPFQSGVSGVQWEEEGYPALVDIHQHDSTRLFSDEPGGFHDPVPPTAVGLVLEEHESIAANQASVSPSGGKRKKTPEGDEQGDRSPATESGPDSPDTESADERPELEEGEGTSGVADKVGGDGLEWENDTPVLSPQKQASQQWAAAADIAEERRWQTVMINGTSHQIDMAAVHPYRRVISHGGYYGEGLNAIAVFAACYLPSRNEADYSYLMDNLFLYTVSMLDMLVAEDYVIIYFQGGATSDQMPPFAWLRKCYHLIDRRHVSHTEVGLDRRLRKNLKAIYLVHPTLWLKTVVTMTKPFISSKFSKKVYFIQALNDLGKLICMDQVEIPDEVLKYDHERVFARTHVSASTSGVSGGRNASRRPTDANDDGSSRRASGAVTATTPSTRDGIER